MMLKNGVEVKIFPAGIIEAMALKNAIQKELLKVGFDIKKIDLSKEINFDSIKNLFLTIDSSEEVQKAAFKCLEKCLYGHEKITMATFDDAEIREYYYDILIECIKVNISPFIKGLVSKFKQVFQGEKNTKNLL